ncbi:hypothetical protein AMTRI_Chr06g170850 [Amborella trichopoda]
MDAPYHGISSSVPHALSSPVGVASAANHDSSLSEQSHSVGHNMNFGFQGMPAFHPHSLLEYHNGLSNGVPYNSPGAISGLAVNINSGPAEGVDGRAIHARGSNGFNNHSYEMNENRRRNLTLLFTFLTRLNCFYLELMMRNACLNFFSGIHEKQRE